MLSKSSYLTGLQCHKALYLSCFQPGLRGSLGQAEQARLQEGREVGMVARGLFPVGVDIAASATLDLEARAQATQRAIAQGAKVIYEAAFIHDSVYAALDILVHLGNYWVIHEVKASTQVKEEHILDVALQLHVARGAGLAIDGVHIVTLNNAYVRQGDIDPKRLFRITSVQEQVMAEAPFIPLRISEMKAVLASGVEPQRAIGPQCSKPHACSFMEHCWKDLPKPSVLDLTRGGRRVWELYGQGIRLIKDIPSSEKLTTPQQRQVDAWKSGLVHIDVPAVRGFVNALRYPLHHFDFETFLPAIPLYEGTRPYQQLPFQYSLHIQLAPGVDPVHKEFLADGSADPREQLIQQLLEDIESEGDILVYHIQFERERLLELARDLPHYAAPLQGIIARLKDLEEPFKSGHYYAPGMNGSSSIKSVLPALVPELSYADLNVRDGSTASMLFTQLALGRYAGDVPALRTDLLAYCGLDTRAMVEILRVLENAVSN